MGELIIGHWNIQGGMMLEETDGRLQQSRSQTKRLAITKRQLLRQYVNKCHVFGVTEPKIRRDGNDPNNPDNPKNQSPIQIDGYTHLFYRSSPQRNAWRGIIVYIRNYLNPDIRGERRYMETEIEYMFVCVTYGRQRRYILVIYFPHKQNREILRDLVRECYNEVPVYDRRYFVVTGDLNIDMKTETTFSLHEELVQRVTDVTRPKNGKGTILDHFWVHRDALGIASLMATEGPSDHLPIMYASAQLREFTIGFWNIEGDQKEKKRKKRIEDIVKDYDVFVVAKARLNGADPGVDGYNRTSYPVPGNPHTFFVFCKTQLAFVDLSNDRVYHTVEFMFLQFRVNNTPITMLYVYKPELALEEDLTELVRNSYNAIDSNECFVAMGDFNIDLNERGGFALHPALTQVIAKDQVTSPATGALTNHIWVNDKAQALRVPSQAFEKVVKQKGYSDRHSIKHVIRYYGQ